MVCNEERKKAFLVYASTYEAAVKHLSLEQMGELFLKLGKYSLEGDTEVESENPLIDILISNAKPLMESAEERHQRAIENGKKGGEKGKENGGGIGRPRKNESKEDYNARTAEWRKTRDEKPPKNPLDIDKDIDRDKEIEIDINKITNSKEKDSSVFTNSSSSLESSNLVGDETKQGAKPSQEDRRQGDNESSKSQQDRTAQADEIDTRFSNPVNLDGVEESEPPMWIDLDPDDLPPLIDEGWTPPSAEFQHNVVRLDNAEPANGKINNSDPEKVALEQVLINEIQTLLDCDNGDKPMNQYRPAFGRAVKTAMDYYGCGEEKAKDYIKQLKVMFRD